MKLRFLVDNNLSPRLAANLSQLGHDCSHVRDFGYSDRDDDDILDLARTENSTLISADSDFAERLAFSGQTSPSVIYLTGKFPSDPMKLSILITNQLTGLDEDLASGAVVAIDGFRVRIRRLPIGGQ